MEERMTRFVAIASALCLSAPAALIGGCSTPAAPPQAGYIGQYASSVAGCPFLIWRLAKHDDGTITGIVYYSDLSGISMAHGHIDPSGQFHLELTSAMGDGPVGVADGRQPATGKPTATLKGVGCANMKMVLDPVDELNRIPQAAG
jgi:hypothetical protein